MKYTVKEIFGPTIQGEADMTGELTHFVRLAGCNMWDGRPETRAESRCPFCDTDFFKGEKLTSFQILERLEQLGKAPWVTISGGEPLLQIDRDGGGDLILKLRSQRYWTALETNGTVRTYLPFDHITCSPKVPPEQLRIPPGKVNTLKVVWPHPRGDEMSPRLFAEHFSNVSSRWIQPIEPASGDKAEWQANIAACIEYMKQNPGDGWRLSAQVHKYIGVE